jgi:hypothetical protein
LGGSAEPYAVPCPPSLMAPEMRGHSSCFSLPPHSSLLQRMFFPNTMLMPLPISNYTRAKSKTEYVK